MKHNYWLQWKMKRGLAPHGRAAGWSLTPNTLVARVVAKVFIKPVPESTDPDGREQMYQVYKQEVGGTVGPTGNMNGEE